MRKVGGLYFFNVGLLGGSVYLNKPALVRAGNNCLCLIYGGIAGWNGAALIHTMIGA